MKITNKYNLPSAVENYSEYTENRKYRPGDADWSVTTLIDSPRVHNLYRKHAHEIETDCSESMYVMLGSAVHALYEKGAHYDHVVEERLYMDVDGYKISGQLDVQEVLPDGRIRIIDFKVTSVYSYTMEPDGKEDWINQQNIYAELVEHNKNVEVESINVCVLYRDWSKSRSNILNSENYPLSPIMVHKLPLWDKDKRLEYIRSRVKEHADARDMFNERGELPLCSPEERWTKTGLYAVHVIGNERATRLFSTEDKAIEYVKGHPGALVIRKREDKHIRCDDWCKVAQWCSQLKAERVVKKIDVDEETK